jgi:Glycosyltransferase 61
MTSVALQDIAQSDPSAARFLSLSPPSRQVARAPDFMFGVLPSKVLSEFVRGYEWVHEQGVWRIPSATLRYPYLMEASGVFANAPWANLHAGHLDPLMAQAQKEAVFAARRAGPHVLLTGPGYQVFGHWLAEFLPKLYTLDALGFDIDSLSFVVPSDTPSFALDILAFSGIRRSQIVLLEPDQALHLDLLVPTTPHNGVRGPGYLAIAGFLKGRFPKSDGSTPEHILLARSGANRACRDRDAIERTASRLGFTLVRPEALPLAEQARVCANARIIVGEYGSPLHWSLLSAPGTIVCGLRGPGFRPGFIQSAIGRALGQPTGYVFGTAERDGWTDEFTVPEAAVQECFEWLLQPHRFAV